MVILCNLQAAFDCLEKFEEEYQNGKARAREKAQKDKTLLTTLQSINEDEGKLFTLHFVLYFFVFTFQL